MKQQLQVRRILEPLGYTSDKVRDIIDEHFASDYDHLEHRYGSDIELEFDLGIIPFAQGYEPDKCYLLIEGTIEHPTYRLLDPYCLYEEVYIEVKAPTTLKPYEYDYHQINRDYEDLYSWY